MISAFLLHCAVVSGFGVVKPYHIVQIKPFYQWDVYFPGVTPTYPSCGVGKKIAKKIQEILDTGKLNKLEEQQDSPKVAAHTHTQDLTTSEQVLMIDTGSPDLWTTEMRTCSPLVSNSEMVFKYGSASVTGSATSNNVVTTDVELTLAVQTPGMKVMFNSTTTGFGPTFTGILGLDMDSLFTQAFWGSSATPLGHQYFTMSIVGLSGQGSLVFGGVPRDFEGSLGCLKMFPRNSDKRISFPAITYTNWWDTGLDMLCIADDDCVEGGGIFFDSGTHGIVIPKGLFPDLQKKISAIEAAGTYADCSAFDFLPSTITYKFGDGHIQLGRSDLVQKTTNKDTNEDECFNMIQFGEVENFFVLGTSIFSRYTLVFDNAGTVAFGLKSGSPSSMLSLPDCERDEPYNMAPPTDTAGIEPLTL